MFGAKKPYDANSPMNQRNDIIDSANAFPAPADDAISSIDFKPSEAGKGGPRIAPWQIILGVIGVLVVGVFWFLFTSKSVQLQFTPAAEEMAISGGPSFELGGVYLLREGTYTLRAKSDLHHDLEQEISVSSERNQSITLAFTPLPGFLDLAIQPSDAQLLIDGVEHPIGAPIELPAGQHEVSVSHPRYLSNAQVLDITGRQETQALEIALDPNWSEVDVMSTPPGATILIDGEDTGIATPGIIEALAGEREISVQLDGHKTHRERIFAQAGLGLALDPIKLVQADAQISVTSSPSGAGVTVNGRFVGQSPIMLDLKSGSTHTIQVIRNGYATHSKQVRLARGDERKLHAPLRRQTGEVVFTAQPADAVLTIDGKVVGKANQTLQLPIQAHSIEIALDGHAGFTQTITPKVGLTQEVRVRLLTLADARLKALKPNIATSAGQNLKLFEPHDFTMGASRREPGRRANETLREVSMSRLFYLSTQEVTNAQFRAFAAGHDSGTFEEASLNDDDMPVGSVSWDEAAAYCNWLSNKDGLAPFYNMEFGKVKSTNPNSIGYRLPTEAEWAWAARTGPKPEDAQLRFPWGPNLPPPDRQGNYADRAASHLVGRIIFGYNDNHAVAAPVGTFKANHRGLYDLGGNMSEWTNDFYAIGDQNPTTDPTGPSSGDYKVIRGSSWMNGTITELRLSFRDYGIDARQDVGFRIARYAE